MEFFATVITTIFFLLNLSCHFFLICPAAKKDNKSKSGDIAEGRINLLTLIEREQKRIDLELVEYRKQYNQAKAIEITKLQNAFTDEARKIKENNDKLARERIASMPKLDLDKIEATSMKRFKSILRG